MEDHEIYLENLEDVGLLKKKCKNLPVSIFYDEKRKLVVINFGMNFSSLSYFLVYDQLTELEIEMSAIAQRAVVDMLNAMLRN